MRAGRALAQVKRLIAIALVLALAAQVTIPAAGSIAVTGAGISQPSPPPAEMGEQDPDAPGESDPPAGELPASGHQTQDNTLSLNFVFPESGKVIFGQVELVVEVIHSEPIAGVAFYLDNLGTEPLAQVEKTAEGSLVSYAWDTSGVSDGAHTVFAQAYDANQTPLGEPAALSVSIKNEMDSGITLRILAPNGEVPDGVIFSVYRRMTEGEEGYDPSAPYDRLWSTWVTDGFIRIPPTLALDLHTYVAVIQGTFDTESQSAGFVYVQQLEAPIASVIDGSATVPVRFSLTGTSGEKLPYPGFFLRLEDDLGFRVTTICLEPHDEFEQLFYLDEGTYDTFVHWSQPWATDFIYDLPEELNAEPVYFLRASELAISEDTRTVSFGREGNVHVVGQLTDGSGESLETFQLEVAWTPEIDDIIDGDGWDYLVLSGKELVLSPGEYDIRCRYSRSDWSYILTAEGLSIDGAQANLPFGGQVTFSGEVAKTPLPESEHLEVRYNLVDEFGNKITSITKPQDQYAEHLVRMYTYDELDSEYYNSKIESWSWTGNIKGLHLCTAGARFVEVKSALGPLWSYRDFSTGRLGFTVVEDEQPTQEAKAIQVYDYNGNIAEAGLEGFSLYSLKKGEDGTRFWGCELTLKTDNDGKLQIPTDTELSPLGNVLTFHGGPVDQRLFYCGDVFTDFDELGDEVRLADCTIQLDISIKGESPWGRLVAFLPDASNDSYLELQLLDGYTLFVTPGHYAAYGTAYDNGKPCIWLHPVQHITSSRTIYVGTENPVALTVNAAVGYQLGFGEDSWDAPGAIAHPDTRIQEFLFLSDYQSYQLLPGDYYAHVWVSRPDPANDPGSYEGYQWEYGISLANSDNEVLRLLSDESFILGGEFKADFTLDADHLTTDDTLRGQVLITDAQGNRVFAVGLRSIYRPMFYQDYHERVTINAAGQLIIPQPEVMVQSITWPFIYPFLRLYQINPDGTEIRILNQCAENYFYDFELPLQALEPSRYRLELAISMGDEILTKSKEFTLNPSSAAVLDKLPVATNQATLDIKGSAGPGALVTIYCRYEGTGEREAVGTATADGIGRFSLQVTLPQDAPDGKYSFTAQAEGTPESQPEVVELDRVAPEPPTELEGEAQDSTHIRLRWLPSADDDVVSYRISRDGIPIDTLTPDKPTSPDKLTYLDAGLAPATPYDYSVVAIDRAGNESGAATISVYTGVGEDTEPPAAPAQPMASYAGGGKATITWQPTTDNIAVTSYRLFRLTDDGDEVELCTVDVPNPGDTPDLTYTAEGLLNETLYRYVVRAYDAAGNASAPSPVCELRTPKLEIYSLTYRFPGESGRPDRNLVYPGTEFTVRMVGEAGRTASVEITYDAPLAQGGFEEKVTTTDLTETASGIYTGEFRLPAGAARLTGLRGILTDGEHPAYRDVSVWLQVAADLTVNIPQDALEELNGLLITVWSNSQRSGRTAMISTDSASYSFKRLEPAADYRITVQGPFHRYLVDQGNVALGPGSKGHIELQPKRLSYITVRVRDDKGNVLKGASVFAYNEHTRMATTAITDEEGLAPLTLNTLEGEEIRLELRPAGELLSLPYPYEDLVRASRAARPGEQTIDLTLPLRSMGTLSGVVTLDEIGSKPLPGVTINAVHVYAGRSFHNSTVTDENGSYTLYLPAGTNILTATTPMGHTLPTQQQPVTVSADEETKADLKVGMRAWSTIDVQLETKFIDRPPLLVEGMDWWTAHHFHLDGYDSLGRRYTGIPLKMRVEPNEEITIKVDGREAGLPTAEKTARVDENRQATVTVQLEEYGRIVGRLVDGQGNDFRLGDNPLAWTVQLLEITAQGSRRVHAVHLDDATFQISVPRPGKYELFISRPSEYVGQVQVKYPMATVGPISVDLYEIRDIGDVSLSWDTTDAKAYFTANSIEVSALGVVNCALRVGRNAHNTLPMQDARVTINLPEGCTLVDGSLSLDGQPITPTSAHPLIIELGDLELAGTAERVLNFSLELSDPLPSAERVLISGHFLWKENGKEQTISPVPVEIMLARVTLNAPSLVVAEDRKTTVSGRGPVGAEVAIYDGEDLLGIATVSKGGYWQLPVTLPNRGYPVRHELRAVCQHNGETLQSDNVSIMYNPNEPIITKVTFRQGKDGRVVTIYPGEGIAKFPYVVRPEGGKFEVDVTFNKPDLVENVRVGVGSFSAGAEGESGKQYHGSVGWSGTRFGSIWVEYDTKRDADDVRQEALTDAELRYQTPPGMRDYSPTVDKDFGSGWRPDDLPGDWPADSQSAAIDLTFGSNSQLSGRVEVTLADAPDYQPTDDGIRVAEPDVSVYGLKVMDPTFADGTMTLWVEAYVPVDKVAVLNARQGRMATASVGGFVRQLTKFNVKYLEEPIDGYENYKDAKDILSAPGMFDVYGDLLDQADNCGAHSDVYRDLIQRAANRKMAAEGVKWGMKLAGCLLAPVSFGWGTVALFAASELIEWAIDDQVEDRLEYIKNEMAADPACRGEDEWWHELAAEIRRKKVADVTWIWDPSGIVYEGVMDNPVEGVKATAYEYDPEEGQFIFWDADWFGQENPLYTDGVGYYGWDVPEGQWQVTYEKEGYAPALSEVLDVPPPQTEVHINLINLSPPEVLVAAARAQGKYLQVTFDQYMLAETLSNATVWVTYQGDAGTEEAGLQYVKGEVKAYNAVVSSDDPDVQITRQLRFVPESELTVGKDYQITIDGIVQSYGGIPMGDVYTETVTVPEADAVVPEVSSLQLEPDYTRIDLSWEGPVGAGLQVEVIWKDSTTGEEVGRKTLTPSSGNYQIPDLFSDTRYSITVRVLDSLGNASTGITQQVKTKKVDMPAEPDGPDDPEPPQPPLDPDPPVIQPLGEVTVPQAQGGDGSLVVSWQDPKSASLKQVKLVWRAKGTDQPLGEQLVEPGVQTFTITGLTNGIEYEVKISTISRQNKESSGVMISGMPLPSTAEQVALSGEQQTMAAFGGDIRLFFPAGAAAGGTRLLVEQGAFTDELADETLTAASCMYTCSIGEAQLASPIYLTLKYGQTLLGAADGRQLGIYRQDAEDPENWVYVGGTVDLYNQQLTVQIDKLGTYAVLLRSPVFSDMQGHWAEQDVKVMAARYLAAGIGGGKFDPDQPINRAELVAFLVRLVEYSGRGATLDETLQSPIFADVAPETWYGEVVEKAARLGIVDSGSKHFRPTEPATREEMADMLLRVLNALGIGTSTGEIPPLPFTDAAQISPEMRPAVAQIWYKGVMGGMGGGLFQPLGTSTRAQAAAVMLRVLERAGLITVPAVAEGRLQKAEQGTAEFMLVDCVGSAAAYHLTPISEEVRRQMTALVGQTVQLTGLREQEDPENAPIPRLRVLGIGENSGL